MDAIALLRHRIRSVIPNLAAKIDGLDGIGIVEPVAPGTSPLGLTLWHVPRTHDWLVNTCLRGVPEVVEEHTTGLPDPERFGFGSGLTPEAARAAAANVELARLLDYANAVEKEVDSWLGTLTDADLDVVPPFHARQQTRSAYATEAALAEVGHLAGLTTGVLLLRPGLSHVYTHLGEIGALIDVARSRTS